MSFSRMLLNNPSDLTMVRYLDDYLKYLQLDRNVIWDKLIDHLNLNRYNPGVLDNITAQTLSEFTGCIDLSDEFYLNGSFDELILRACNTLKYLSKRIKSKGFISFSGIDSSGITVTRSPMTINLKKQLERDLVEHALDTHSGSVVIIPIREVYRILEKLDSIMQGLLDYDAVLRNLLSFISKNSIASKRISTDIDLSGCMLDEIEADISDENIEDIELLLKDLANKLLIELKNSKLIKHKQLSARYLYMPNSSSCMFLINGENINEILQR